jgi:hypothetical protein
MVAAIWRGVSFTAFRSFFIRTPALSDNGGFYATFCQNVGPSHHQLLWICSGWGF